MSNFATPSVRPAVRRCTAITVASLANALVWIIGRVVHISYIAPTPLGTREVTLLLTVAATVTAGLAGWLILAILEHYSADPRRPWTALALVVLALSIVPVFIAPAAIGTQVVLTIQHCVAAAVLIPGLLRRH